jgi:hypothetical protein
LEAGVRSASLAISRSVSAAIRDRSIADAPVVADSTVALFSVVIARRD